MTDPAPNGACSYLLVTGCRCASVKRPKALRMKEPYGEGPASHPQPRAVRTEPAKGRAKRR